VIQHWIAAIVSLPLLSCAVLAERMHSTVYVSDCPAKAGAVTPIVYLYNDLCREFPRTVRRNLTACVPGELDARSSVSMLIVDIPPDVAPGPFASSRGWETVYVRYNGSQLGAEIQSDANGNAEFAARIGRTIEASLRSYGCGEVRTGQHAYTILPW
jgi:hypothetical protein